MNEFEEFAEAFKTYILMGNRNVVVEYNSLVLKHVPDTDRLEGSVTGGVVLTPEEVKSAAEKSFDALLESRKEWEI